MKDEVTIYLDVEVLSGDPRQYMQNTLIFKPKNLRIAVKLELHSKYFVGIDEYYEQRKLWELGQGEKPIRPDENELILTPLGLATVREQLEEPYNSPIEVEDYSNLFEGEQTDF